MVKLDFGLHLYKVQDFLVKYPQYNKEIEQSGLDGIVLLVPQNVHIEDYINLQNIFDKKTLKKLVIIVEKCSHVKIYDNIKIYRDINCFLQEGAHLEFLQDIALQKKSTSLKFHLQKSSKLVCFLLFASEYDIQSYVHISLLGEHASAHVKGFYLAIIGKQLDIQTYQNHVVKNTISAVLINGVSTDGSFVKYRGNIFVGRDASGSNVTQKNKNIVLDHFYKEKLQKIEKSAEVDVMPQMEILNNDVHCNHGCAIGGLDKVQMFYLQSRGLSQKVVKKILIERFFDFLINLSDTQIIKKSLIKRIKVKMGQML